MSSEEEPAEDCSEQDFYDTVQENAFLADIFEQYGSPSRFVERSEKIFVRSLMLDSGASSVWLDYQTDIDGCVIELSELTGFHSPVRHITLCPLGAFSLKEVKGMLKKHVNLSQYSSDALFNFNHSFGIQLFYEIGWECWLALVPDSGVRVYKLNREVIRNDTFAAFEKVRRDFGTTLAEYANDGKCYRTLAKNDISDLRKMFVLPDDCPNVLAALQSAVSQINVRHFQPIVFCFRFGEKMTNGLSLREFGPESIKKVTVHAAVDISCNSHDIELLWASYGLQQVVGCRGTLSACLSLFDCANYQSNLDGKAMDIKPELRRVFSHPDKVTFVQVYADLPHIRPQSRIHPVSGIIAGGLCFPTNMANAFRRDARKYISVMVHNFSMLRRSTCRLEGVCELTEFPDVIQATDCIEVDRLDLLLQEKALLSPIPSRTLNCIRGVGLWLCKELSEMLSHESTGNLYAIWRAFQCELACEKLLWGRPLANKISVHSINLGPGVLGASRSLTDTLGFIALEHPTSCMQAEDSIPPPTLWTGSVGLGQSISRAAGFHDYLDASFPVIGRLLVLALLKDLHATGKMDSILRFESFLVSLKSDPSPFPVVGAASLEELSTVLAMKRRHAVFAVFGKLCGLIEKHRLPLREIIEAGLIETGIKVFPAVETHDTHGNAVLKWDRRQKFWKVITSSQSAETTTVSAELYSQLAKAALEMRGIIFPSRLKKLPTVWPWVEPCLRKLEREKLGTEATTTTLAFVSTLAFLMQGWYVDFNRFAQLVCDLPVQQFRLKTLEIQSRLQLATFNYQNMRVFRLHESIPHQIKMEDKRQEQSEPDERPSEDMPTDVESAANLIPEEEDLAVSSQQIERRVFTCQPAGIVKVTWSSEEIELLEQVSSNKGSKSVREMYVEFRNMAMRNKITFRTFEAFKLKMRRLIKSDR